ncbi:MAG: hypothetical protein ACRC4N_14955 [Gammaproteobacteria bacterium]
MEEMKSSRSGEIVLIIAEGMGPSGQVFFFLGLKDRGQRESIVKESEDTSVSIATSKGREEKESGSGREERV